MKKVNRSAQLDDIRKETSIKNLYYGRLLMVRYVFALFLFVNFYYLVASIGSISMIVPMILLISSLPVCIELITAYGKKDPKIKFIKRYYQIQMFVNIILFIACISSFFTVAFPFLIETIEIRVVLSVVMFIGCLVCYLCLVKLHKIQTKTDKPYVRVQQYEKALHV